MKLLENRASKLQSLENENAFKKINCKLLLLRILKEQNLLSLAP